MGGRDIEGRNVDEELAGEEPRLMSFSIIVIFTSYRASISIKIFQLLK